MRSSTWRLEDLRNVILNLGFVGENLHTRQIFDCKKMFDQYPNASVSMTVTPPEGEPYPGTIERDGDLVIWDVRDSDLVAEGDGEIQIVFTQSPHIARSYNARTHVCRSQVPTGNVPSGLDDFITRADQLLDQVEDTFPAGGTTGQVLAKKSDADYDTEWVPQSGGGGGTSDYEELENLPQIGGVTLKGNKSLSDLGAASASDLSAKYTKPAGGIPATDLADGVIPDPTSIIDDTAGDGDTNKVWSADKSSALLTEIQSSEDQIIGIKEEVENYTEIALDAAPSGWRLNESDGLCHADASYKLAKYKVIAGKQIKIVSDDRFQFQTVSSVPSSGTSNKVGDVYGAGTFYLTVPETATYLVMSTPTTDSGAVAYTITSKFPDIEDSIADINDRFTIVNQKSRNLFDVSKIELGKYYWNGSQQRNAGYNASDIIPVNPGDKIYLQTGGELAGSRSNKDMRFVEEYNSNKGFVSDKTDQNPYTVPASGVAYIRISASSGNFAPENHVVILASENGAVEDYIEYFAPYQIHELKDNWINRRTESGLVNTFNINSDNHGTTEELQDMFDYSIQFRGLVTTFNGIIVAHGYQQTMGGHVEVTSTHFKY